LVYAAYDPNVKYVTPLGEDTNYATKVSERDFTYTIHFQNTGNYSATDVVVTDTISQFLDQSTFYLMGASHDVSVSSFNNVIEFMFEDINLPDSTTNEMESKGFVQFRIEATAAAHLGDTIRNSANIYFDNNPPIITPDAINIYYKPVIQLDTVAVTCEGTQVAFYGITYTTAGLHEDTLVGYFQDSIFVADITLNPVDSMQLSTTICPSDSVDFYGTYIQAEGFYNYIMTNVYGCDSIQTMQIIHNPIDQTDISVSICPGDSVDFYGTYVQTPGFYAQTMTNEFGCDSLITLELIQNPTTSSQAYVEICENESYDFHGTPITTAGNYSYQMVNQYGCDSTELVTVSIYSVDTTIIVVSEVELQVATAGNSYQWYNCSAQQEVSGATAQQFQPTINGNYAVIVNDGTCQDTSSCYSINTIGLAEKILPEIQIKPNPTTGKIYVTGVYAIEVFDILGSRLSVRIEEIEENLQLVNLSNFTNGVYLIKVENLTYRIIKQ
jgi:hypothetical protein